MDQKYRMVVGVDVDGRSYVLPVKYMENGLADGRRANYILRELRRDIAGRILSNPDIGIKITVHSNVPPLGVFALATVYDLAGEVNGRGSYQMSIGLAQDGADELMDCLESFLRVLAKVSLIYMSGAPVPR